MKKNMVFLMDPLFAPSGLFGDTFNSDVNRYQEGRKQVVAFQRFLPRPFIVLGAAEREQPQPCTSSSYREIQKQSGVYRITRCLSLLSTLWRSFCQPCQVSGHSGLQRVLLLVLSTQNRCGAESLATHSGVSRAATSDISCRSFAPGH